MVRPRAARPLGGQRRLLPPAVHLRGVRAARRGSSSSAPRAAWPSRPTATATCWPGGASGSDAVLVGSHLDSVLDGGAYDGPLGVVSSLAAIDLLRSRGVHAGADRWSWVPSPRRRARASGSPASVRGSPPGRRRPRPPGSCGTVTAYPCWTRWPRPASSRRWDGPTGSTGSAASSSCTSSRVATSSTATRWSGWPREIWPHGRYRFDFTGEANHAGTTRMEDRHDPMLSYAMTALAASKQARLAGQRATFGRSTSRPTAPTRSRRG